jgi:hypothetical protein
MVDAMRYQMRAMLVTVAAVLMLAAAPACDDDTCEWRGETYQRGESFPAGDGCNTCHCGDDGQVSCTLVACPIDGGT